MKANENNFSFMQNEEIIEIPFFQRPYVWKEDQWEQLFDDLLNSYTNKTEHFLGSIVLKQVSTNAGEGSKRNLIDGQQRLTTFSILVKSLYDKLEDDSKVDYAGYLFKRPTKNKEPKIKHSKYDEAIFSKILKANCYDDIMNGKEKLISAYKYFVEKIKVLDNYSEFLQFIVNSNLWVVINLDSNEDEQKIFDSINTAGLKLTATDIIKNALFAKAISLNCDYVTLYQKYWEEVFEKDKHRKFWEQEVATGRIKRVQSEIFLHAFAIIQGFFSLEDNLERLSEVYKNYFKDFDKEKLENFIKDIHKYAMVYKNFPHITEKTIFSFEKFELRLFHILHQTSTNTIIPLILYLKLSLISRDNDLEKSFFLLETFILTNWLCCQSTKDYNKLFAGIVGKLKNCNNIFETLKESLQDRMPGAKEIEQALFSNGDHCLTNNRAKLILFWIELYRRHKNQNKQDIVELNYIYTLEHLIPQSWETYWKDACFNEENVEKLIYQIGNMTLLKGSLNNSIKNREWIIKLNGDGSRKNNITSCADLLITKELLDKQQWGEKEVDKRSKQLIKEFFEIWQFK